MNLSPDIIAMFVLAKRLLFLLHEKSQVAVFLLGFAVRGTFFSLVFCEDAFCRR